MRNSGNPEKCRLVYHMGQLGKQVFEFEAADYLRRGSEIREKNPPGPTVQNVILETPFTNHLDFGGCNDAFSWDAYEKALEEKNFSDAYFQRTGKRWNAEPTNDHSRQAAPEVPTDEPNLTPDQCAEILGLKPGFSAKDLKQAYNRAVKMNHPDRVASLSPEFIALAEKRTKQINQAYAKLKQGK